VASGKIRLSIAEHLTRSSEQVTQAVHLHPAEEAQLPRKNMRCLVKSPTVTMTSEPAYTGGGCVGIVECG
jgi:hypothetical protein